MDGQVDFVLKTGIFSHSSCAGAQFYSFFCPYLWLGKNYNEYNALHHIDMVGLLALTWKFIGVIISIKKLRNTHKQSDTHAHGKPYWNAPNLILHTTITCLRWPQECALNPLIQTHSRKNYKTNSYGMIWASLLICMRIATYQLAWMCSR